MDTEIGGLPVGLCMPWRKFPVIPASGTGEIGRSVGSMIVSLLLLVDLLVVLPGPGLVTVLQMCPPVTSLGRRPIAVYERTGEWGGAPTWECFVHTVVLCDGSRQPRHR